VTPTNGIWAAPATINAASPPADVDGLEVWGPDGPAGDDANKFSLIGDPVDPGSGVKVSVWNWIGGAASPYITTASLTAAIGLAPAMENQVDLDAMMIFDGAGDDTFTFEGGGSVPADSIMFSVAPIAAAGIDGGEIWVWDFGMVLPAPFLVHGGEVWSTAHSVAGHFGLALTDDNENINALEAVPEPTTLGLLVLGGLGLLRRRRANSA